MTRQGLGICWVAVAANLVLGTPCKAGESRTADPTRYEAARYATRTLEERQRGKAMFEEYLADAVPWPGERVNEYVNRLGQNLVRATEAPGIFTFRVIRSPEPNAQAFPGGFVVVHSGLIALAGSEAELASVVGHEIAHVRARHWQRQRRRQTWFSLLATAPLMVSTGPLSWVIFYAAAAASPLANARFSRSFEMEADGLALEYLARAGYDPAAGVSMIEKYRSAQGRRGSGKCGLMSTHPSGARRVQRAREWLRRIALPEAALESTSEFESIRDDILGPDRAAPSPFHPLPQGTDDPPPPWLHRAAPMTSDED